ncbi:MAG: hypothetical protein Q4F11_09560 [Eubacteriales bacterium]|nr:hypothetical protein [Eubacteriales bacterium]
MDDCKKIQSMIVPFELDKLSLHDEEHFIKHLCSCKDCKEEFEIHYIVAYGLEDDEKAVKLKPEYRKLLDVYDFTGLVDLKIKNSLKKIERIKRQNRHNIITWLICNGFIAAALIIYILIQYY